MLEKLDVKVQKLLGTLKSESRAKHRAEAARVLGEFDTHAETILPCLAESLQVDPNPVVREAVGRSIGRMGEKASSVLPVLLAKLTQDEDAIVRGRVALTLGRIDVYTPEVIDALVASMQKDPDVKARSRAAWALGEIGDAANKAIPELQKVVALTINKPRLFFFAIPLISLEGSDSEAIGIIKNMRDEGELEPWMVIHFQNLCRELNVEEEIIEATQEFAQVKQEVLSVQNDVRKVQTKIESQPNSNEKTELLEITTLLNGIITEQKVTIATQEKQITSLRKAYQEQVRSHQTTIEELRVTAIKMKDMSTKKETFWERFSGEIIVGVITSIFGVVGTILAAFLA